MYNIKWFFFFRLGVNELRERYTEGWQLFVEKRCLLHAVRSEFFFKLFSFLLVANPKIFRENCSIYLIVSPRSSDLKHSFNFGTYYLHLYIIILCNTYMYTDSTFYSLVDYIYTSLTCKFRYLSGVLLSLP